MLPDPARRFSIRPSRPDVQRKRNETIAQTKAARAARKLDKATAPKAAKASATVKPDDHRGFAEMWRAFRTNAADLLDDLDGEDVAKIHALAWRHHHAVVPTNEWYNMIMALTERARANQPVQPEKRWRGGIGRNQRLDGW